MAKHFIKLVWKIMENPLGLNEDEIKESLGTLFFMARNLNADLMVTKVK